MQAVINKCYGGFGLSDEALAHLGEYPDVNWSQHNYRTEPALVRTVEALGERASEDYANLVIVEIEPNKFWRITEYDGYESIEYFDKSKWFKS